MVLLASLTPVAPVGNVWPFADIRGFKSPACNRRYLQLWSGAA